MFAKDLGMNRIDLASESASVEGVVSNHHPYSDRQLSPLIRHFNSGKDVWLSPSALNSNLV